MTFQRRIVGDAFVIHIDTQDLTLGEGAGALFRQLAIESEMQTCLTVLDLSKVVTVDSSALIGMLSLNRTMRVNGCVLAVCGPNSPVIADLMRLTRVFDTIPRYETVEEAVLDLCATSSSSHDAAVA